MKFKLEVVVVVDDTQGIPEEEIRKELMIHCKDAIGSWGSGYYPGHIFFPPNIDVKKIKSKNLLLSQVKVKDA